MLQCPVYCVLCVHDELPCFLHCTSGFYRKTFKLYKLIRSYCQVALNFFKIKPFHYASPAAGMPSSAMDIRAWR